MNYPMLNSKNKIVISYKKVLKHKMFVRVPFLEFFRTLNPEPSSVRTSLGLKQKQVIELSLKIANQKLFNKAKLMGTNFL